jgi:hypothetical protein
MRFLIRARAREAGNKMVQDPDFMNLEDYMNKFKPEAAYFLPIDGHRTAAFIVNIENSSQVPATSGSFDNLRFKVVNPQAYPIKEALEMQIMKALKHSSGHPVSVQENNSLPKIFDETCKIQKNARMLVKEVFIFSDRYFAKGWLDDSRLEDGGERGNKDETSTSEDNMSVAVTKSVKPTMTAKNKNEIDPIKLNEFLLSLAE